MVLNTLAGRGVAGGTDERWMLEQRSEMWMSESRLPAGSPAGASGQRVATVTGRWGKEQPEQHDHHDHHDDQSMTISESLTATGGTGKLRLSSESRSPTH
eukprot:3226835-Rhodomonas_salina.1